MTKAKTKVVALHSKTTQRKSKNIQKEDYKDLPTIKLQAMHHDIKAEQEALTHVKYDKISEVMKEFQAPDILALKKKAQEINEILKTREDANIFFYSKDVPLTKGLLKNLLEESRKFDALEMRISNLKTWSELMLDVWLEIDPSFVHSSKLCVVMKTIDEKVQDLYNFYYSKGEYQSKKVE